MYKLLLQILILLFGAATAQAALVTGMVRNASPGASVAIEVPHYYLDGRTGHFRGNLDGQLQFSMQVDVPEPGIAFFLFNDDRLPIFLGNDDTLSLKTDIFQFPITVSFGGKNGGNNRVFQEYLKQNQLDFNEFNNIRFKIGQTWVIVEEPVNSLMESLSPEFFKSVMDARRTTSQTILDDFAQQNPEALTPEFSEWLSTEILYSWAYHLLVYGHVYGGKNAIQPEFFDFLFDAPIISNTIGSEWYRQFVIAFMARQQAKSTQVENGWVTQYNLAETLLSGKSLAFFRSDLIVNAFSGEHYIDILPIYKNFLQTNPFKAYDDKVEGLYQKYARVSPGVQAPDFEGTDQGGNNISLAQFKGKTVYLNFWASWCGACLRKMDFFDEFETELTANNIVIVNISIDENPANWESALAAHPYKGYHLLASSGKMRNIAATYGVEAVPQYFIIGANGLFEIKAMSSQPNDIREKLLDISRKGH